MRSWYPALFAAGLLTGCAGNIADHIGPRSGIIAEELPRYGFDTAQSTCLAEKMGASLTPLQLRRLARVAASVHQGYFDPDRLTPRDFTYIAGTMEDGAVAAALAEASQGCGLSARDAEPEPQPVEKATPKADEPEQAWLNLGAAPTGQSIAVDASTIEQDGSSRKAWFRLTTPGEEPNGVTYWLRIDCAARIIDPLAHRVHDASGAVTESSEYPADQDDAMPIEGGTVMQIAYLALCT